MQSTLPSGLSSEPIGIAAAFVGVIEWALHAYIPDMPPGIVVAVGAIAVWLLARPWTVSHAHHVCEVEDIGNALNRQRDAAGPDRRVEPPFTGVGERLASSTVAGLVLCVLLAGAGAAHAQGLGERLEQIGRSALDGAVAEGLTQAEEVVGVQQAQQAQQAQVPAPVVVVEPDPDTIEVTRGQLATAAVIGFLCLLVIVLFYRQGQRTPPPTSVPEQVGLFGAHDAAALPVPGSDPLETYRLAAVKRLFVITFAASVFVQTLEVAAEAFYPGFELTLNVAHIFLLALSALWATVWTMFGPFDRYVLPRVKWYELLTGETYGAPPEGWKPMHVAIRCTVIGSMFYLIAQLLIVVATNPG